MEFTREEVTIICNSIKKWDAKHPNCTIEEYEEQLDKIVNKIIKLREGE